MEYVKISKNVKDITGQRFGFLVALGPVGINKCGQMQWECECDCGDKIIVSGSNLRRGHSTSCGKCAMRGKFLENLKGKTFGLLTVISDVNYINNIPMWECECKCGNHKIISSRDLLQDRVKSCGCLKMSQLELNVANYLKSHNIDYDTEYSFPDLYYKDICHPLRFDFIIYNNQNICCLLECQGSFHYLDNDYFHTEDTELRDKLKIDYCNNNKLNLEYINYNDDIILSLERIINKYGLSSDN